MAAVLEGSCTCAGGGLAAAAATMLIHVYGWCCGLQQRALLGRWLCGVTCLAALCRQGRLVARLQVSHVSRRSGVLLCMCRAMLVLAGSACANLLCAGFGVFMLLVVPAALLTCLSVRGTARGWRGAVNSFDYPTFAKPSGSATCYVCYMDTPIDEVGGGSESLLQYCNGNLTGI